MRGGLTMMGTRGKLNGTEVDAFSGWRKYYCYLQRSGVRKWIKRHFWRRQRAAERSKVRQED